MRLHIAVNRALAVSIIERSRDRPDDPDRIAELERAALLEDQMQRAAAQILHRDIAQPILLANIEDRDDIGVAQVGRGDRLTLEAPRELRIDRQLRRQHLERDDALELRIERSIHPRHAAAPDLLLNQIAAKLLPYQVCKRRLLSDGHQIDDRRWGIKDRG